MMLQGSFYTVQGLASSEGLVTGELVLNPAHPILAGHFPGAPVVPGVCMMAMVKEITQTVTGKKHRLLKADHLKFLHIVDPGIHPVLRFEIKYAMQMEHTLMVSANLLAENVLCFKFNGSFHQM